MAAPHGTYLLAALTLFAAAHLRANAGEVVADPVCRSCRPAVSAYPAPACYDPCPPVGPVRRFLRRVFRPCCPPAPVAVVAVPSYTPAYVPAPAPQYVMPRAVIAPAPAVQISPPVVPEPATPFPTAGSSFRKDVGSVPVRADRIASLQGEPAPIVRARAAMTPVTLVSADDTARRVRADADNSGLVVTVLPRGIWRVYTSDAAGKSVAHGKVDVEQSGEVRIRLKSGF